MARISGSHTLVVIACILALLLGCSAFETALTWPHAVRPGGDDLGLCLSRSGR